MKKSSPVHPRTIHSSPATIPPPPAIDDELFTTGVFYWNISAILVWLENTLSKGIKHETIAVPVDIWKPSYANHPMNPEHVAAADITRPLILAEIAPDYKSYRQEIRDDDWLGRGYQLIDGYHRVEKAKGLGLETLPAVVLQMEEHIPFMYKGYERYVDYWNGKLRDRR